LKGSGNPADIQRIKELKEGIAPTVQEGLDKMSDIFTQYRDAGYSKKDFERQYKSENDLDKIPGPIQKIINDVFK